ncbi:MAG: thiamine phosphate synthase [Ectothiorhodospiraceae bacterium]|nr:thiamine phosphate synthase [Chromatiales bacterium]MCP5153482.1 thiamine phosphate synthase [Ectothiorhodospiraceae bacterium]
MYAVTLENDSPPGTRVRAVRAALRGGARVVQYRDKSTDAARRRAEASALLAACRDAGARLIVNDDIALAAEIGADGVHVGRDDASPRAARAALGPAAIIGVSCYDSLELAEAAMANGADYVAFGSFFPSPTKPHAVRPDIALLTRARARLGRVPLVAIGGITPENGADLVAAGADMLAVVTGVFATPDPEAAARTYAALFAASSAAAR